MKWKIIKKYLIDKFNNYKNEINIIYKTDEIFNR